MSNLTTPITCPDCGTGDVRKLRVMRVVVQQLGLTATDNPIYFLHHTQRDATHLLLHCDCGASFPLPPGARVDIEA